MVAEIRNASSPDEAFLIEKFIKKKISKSIYACKKLCYITVDLRQELDFLRHILSHPRLYIWRGPIAHLIPRSSDYSSWGDTILGIVALTSGTSLLQTY